MNPIQGNDPRKNYEKPETTWQESYFITGADGNPLKVLRVHVSDDPNSAVYFNGIPEMYKGGAVKRDNLEPDFIGDPAEAGAGEKAE